MTTAKENQQEQEFYVNDILDMLHVVQKLPGEYRPIASMNGIGLSRPQRERYARMICDTLNAAREFVRRCEAGEIKSVRSYATFKAALEGQA